MPRGNDSACGLCDGFAVHRSGPAPQSPTHPRTTAAPVRSPSDNNELTMSSKCTESKFPSVDEEGGKYDMLRH
jgi:hypothetical protein